MVWFKVDDGFWSHPKVLPLSADAVALWVRAGAYCAHQLTNGLVSPQALRMLADRDAAVELANAGLWDVVPGGFQFHDWAKYQPTREQVEAERAAAAERKRKSRETSRRKSREASHRDARGADAVIGGSAPKYSPPPASVRAPDPFCAKHMPTGPSGKPCRACADARVAVEAHRAAAKARPTATPFTVVPGALCPNGAHTLLPDGTCTRCEYRPEVA
ncbi:hypothetical protein [Microbacterium sp. 22242]|uniref:hypothetical protein n=1 Tax=Microbacterium sp. 22242 TaxID=3453896 RepID=UPI003F85B496